MTSTTSLRGDFNNVSSNPWYTATQLATWLQGLVDKTPAGDPRRRAYLTDLSAVFKRRHTETGNLQYLEAAVQAIEEALSFFSADDSAGSLITQHPNMSQDLEDLEYALQTAQDADILTLADHCDRPARLEYLSQLLVCRYRISKDSNDMERSIRCSQEAIKLTPMDDYLRASLSRFRSFQRHVTRTISIG
ncbi:hypothetical protein B0H11DRAFT_688191 [Mycena galericulata]|nr:hypothetical protein B0H11DRAFT_688191 [Mycena galericulata]